MSALRTRIKICGIKTQKHARVVTDCGADSIGLVFHPASARYIDLDNAEEIRRHIPAFVSVTALFLNDEVDWVRQVIDRVRPDCLQFHGTEPADYCESFDRPYIKAVPMASVEDLNAYVDSYPLAQGFLLDSNAAGRLGGSGDTFDWSKIPSSFQRPLILAGGLTPNNIADAVTQVRPWAVDVSSGVEQSRGVKDSRLIQQFCNEVFRVDCRIYRSD